MFVVPPPPRLATLRKYGLDISDWRRLCESCKCVCVICGKPFEDRPLVIDHEHVKGFKARKTRTRKGKAFKVRVMPPEERKKYVRGVLHSFCNRYVRRWLTLDRAEAIVRYLRAYEARKKSDILPLFPANNK